MPFLKSRYDYIKIYRPRGSRFAHGGTHATPEIAVALAMVKFHTEFGERPRDDQTIIEVVGVTGGYAATVFEIK